MKNENIVCANQRCKSSDKTAVAICFSQDCAMFNATDHRPVRYCTQCNKMNHQENTPQISYYQHSTSQFSLNPEINQFKFKPYCASL